MTAELPRPGSVWFQVTTARMMRVCYSEINDVVAHDAELSDTRDQIVTWRGTAGQFFAAFRPGDPNLFPKTAGNQ